MSNEPIRYIGTEEVMKRLRISRSTVYRLIEAGTLVPRPKKVSLRKRATLEFPESQIDKLLSEEAEENLPVAS